MIWHKSLIIYLQLCCQSVTKNAGWKIKFQLGIKYCKAKLVSSYQKERLTLHYLMYPYLDKKEKQISSDEDKENQECNQTIICWYC